MGHKLATPVLLLTLAAAFLLVSSIPLHKEGKKRSDKGEKRQTCIPKCANPRGFTGCGSCKHSRCMLKGCVHYGAFGPFWKPDNCTTCHCERNKMKCYQENCITPECFGYPMVKRPGKCCKKCDFGAARNECKLIPVALRNVSLGSDANTTCKQVLKHDCNRNIVSSGGKWYKCVAEEGMAELRGNAGCDGIEGRYQDKISCKQEEVGPEYIPQDYEDNPSSCSIYIH